MDKRVLVLLFVYGVIAAFSTYSIFQISSEISPKTVSKGIKVDADLSSVRGTGEAMKAVFELEKIENENDAIEMLIPQGTPAYGNELGVSYDNPVASLQRLAGMWENYSSEVRERNPAVWKRFVDLASKPVGISCEFCCGVGPIGIDSSGRSRCGCQHNPALLSLALWLMENTDMSDAEIVAETLRWKSLFFPKNMVELAMSMVVNGESSGELPEMVGGC